MIRCEVHAALLPAVSLRSRGESGKYFMHQASKCARRIENTTARLRIREQGIGIRDGRRLCSRILRPSNLPTKNPRKIHQPALSRDQ